LRSESVCCRVVDPTSHRQRGSLSPHIPFLSRGSSALRTSARFNRWWVERPRVLHARKENVNLYNCPVLHRLVAFVFVMGTTVQAADLSTEMASIMGGPSGAAVVVGVASGHVLAAYKLYVVARRLARPRSAFKPFTLLALLQSVKLTTTDTCLQTKSPCWLARSVLLTPADRDRYRPSRRWLIHVTLRARARPCRTMLIAFGNTWPASEQNFHQFSKNHSN
jgi:hypothetical protein